MSQKVLVVSATIKLASSSRRSLSCC